MPKLTYLTHNEHKVEEANMFFRDKYGFDLEILSPSFEIIEIQAASCAEVVKFSVKYASDKLGIPVLKSDSGLYLECLGGLPGPYNAYFDKQIGADQFLHLLSPIENRNARLEHAFGYCEPGKDPVVFVGGSSGTISTVALGTRGRWHDKFYIPSGETRTLSQLREIDPDYEASFWGSAIADFAAWYQKTVLKTALRKNDV